LTLGLLRHTYNVCDEAEESGLNAIAQDAVLGPYITEMHGTKYGGARRLEIYNIVARVAFDMVEPGDSEFTFDESKFERAWTSVVATLCQETVDCVIAAPIPHLIIEGGSLRLPGDMVLGPLTDDDLDLCIRRHVLHVDDERPMLMAWDSVGIHRQTPMEVIRFAGERPNDFWTSEEGSFGRRLPNDAIGTVDDILLLLRLFQPCWVRCSGAVTYTDGLNLGFGIMLLDSRAQAINPTCRISTDAAADLLALFDALVLTYDKLAFPLRRFSSACGRNSIDDVLIDLIISAEALLLNDIDEVDRGELRFRFALRSALFFESERWDRRGVYRIMRDAYDIRSGVVHAGKGSTSAKLPGGSAVPIHEFTTEVAELIRVALRKAVRLLAAHTEFRRSTDWLALALPLESDAEIG
jgi:hypothetical protein